MNKTAVFTSLTMLLSIAQYGFTAESASSLSTSPSTDRYLREAKHRMTPDTRWKLQHVILPSIEGMRGDLTGVIDEATLGVKGLATIGSAVYSFKKVAAAGAISPVAGVAAALTSPAALSAVSVAVDWHQKRKISQFSNRLHSTPVLHMNLLEGRSNLGMEEANSANPHPLFFDMQTGRATNIRGTYKKGLSQGGIEGEGENSGTTDWESERKIRGNISVKIDYPDTIDEGILKPEISIWKCQGYCGAHRESLCPKGTCSVHQQTLQSPPNLCLASFAPSLCGEQLAVGFTNGTVGILHMDNEIYPGEGWSWTEWFEQNKAGGKPLFLYIKEHQDFLRKATGRIEASDIGAGAASVHVAGHIHPAAGLATAAVVMGANAHAKTGR